LTTKDISIVGNSNHFEWRAELLDILFKRDNPMTIPEKFALIWFSVFRGEDLNVICYQNMPNLQNRYKSAEGNISQKNLEYMFTKNRNVFSCQFLIITDQNELKF
jgi:hypothetical protein